MEETNSNKAKNAVVVFLILACGVLIGLWAQGGGWEKVKGYFTVETIVIDGLNKELVIDHPTKVHLNLNGDKNTIIISGDTRLKSVSMNGNENVLKLCRRVHNPEINEVGFDNEIEFVSC